MRYHTTLTPCSRRRYDLQTPPCKLSILVCWAGVQWCKKVSAPLPVFVFFAYFSPELGNN